MANTGLIFNTMAQLEDFLGNGSIHTNGIRRCYPNFPRLRGLYVYIINLGGKLIQ